MDKASADLCDCQANGPHSLVFREDLYHGVIVDAASLPPAPTCFAAALAASLAAWRAAGTRGVWLPVPIGKSALIPLAVACGFFFHHAEAAHLMLAHWLDESTPSRLPQQPSTNIGVGAFLLNPAGELLVVQEKSGPAARAGFWKVPTGLVDAGEAIAAAVEREVLEETGVRADFEGIVGFRQAHGLAFGKDDLFFLCALRLRDAGEAARELAPQESEIAAARWMPLAEFEAMPHVSDAGTVWGHLHQLCVQASAGTRGLITPRLLPLGLRPGSQVVYAAH